MGSIGTDAAGVGPFYLPIPAPRVGPFCAPITTQRRESGQQCEGEDLEKLVEVLLEHRHDSPAKA